MFYLSNLPKIAPLLLLALLVVAFLFAVGRKGISPGWRRLPLSRHEWIVLWLHALEALVFCSTLAVFNRAGDAALGLMLGCAGLLFISVFGPVPLCLRIHAWIVLLLWLMVMLFGGDHRHRVLTFIKMDGGCWPQPVFPIVPAHHR